MTFDKFTAVAAILTYFVASITALRVSLRVPKYVMIGGSATLYCDYDVQVDQLHKVEWHKGNQKILQYIRGRSPPYRNYTFSGGTIDWTETDRKKLTLKKLQFEASGDYTCEVTTDTPIYTKPSDEHHMMVIESQVHDPRITFNKANFTVGDIMNVNCTSGQATPVPELAWLLNGNLANESLIRSYPEHTKFSSSMVELTMVITEEYVPQLRLTCLSTIPGFLGHHASTKEYADYRSHTITVDISPAPTESARILESNRCSSISWNFQFLVTLSLMFSSALLIS